MDTSLTASWPVATATLNKTRPTAPPTLLSPTLEVTEQRVQLFRQQEQAVQGYYEQLQTPQYGQSASYPLFYLTHCQSQFIESQKLRTAYQLNARDVVGLEHIRLLFNQLHVVDDQLMAVVNSMPPQRPIGWQLASQGQNLMNLPTTLPARLPAEARGIEQSLAATILQFFGVSCYSVDKGYFVGHILGYLFCCYYFAHLGLSYSVTPLKEAIAKDYPYQSVNVPQLIRLLQQTNETLKAKVYQLAVYAAQISEYAIDKRIERMLIAEVNSFNKQALRDELASFLPIEDDEKSALFQPLKPLK